ncbi:MAG: DUF992 domain-containing protein [Dongiaceae bacterium]
MTERPSSHATAAALAAMIAAFAAGGASAEGGVKAGYLKCDVEGNVSFIFGSSRDIFCTYTPQGTKRVDRYSGTIEQYGLDIGYRENGVMLWGIIAPTGDVGPGALAGSYGGASASVAAVYGVGANALVGGSKKSIVLQPLSVEGIQGLNLAAGIGVLKLRAR